MDGTDVSCANRLTAGDVELGHGFSVFGLAREGDSWKVRQHVWVGTD